MSSLPTNPSAAFVARNPHLYGNQPPKRPAIPSKMAQDAFRCESVVDTWFGPVPVSELTEADRKVLRPKTVLRLTLAGQVRGGKNNIRITKTGHRYPNAKWAVWRDEAVDQIKRQLPADFKPFTGPCSVQFHYYAKDRIRRDAPAIIDAVWHVLEKAGVVTDDTHLWPTVSSRDYDKQNPRVELIIETK